VAVLYRKGLWVTTRIATYSDKERVSDDNDALQCTKQQINGSLLPVTHVIYSYIRTAYHKIDICFQINIQAGGSETY
jgi:hypothetical protein